MKGDIARLRKLQATVHKCLLCLGPEGYAPAFGGPLTDELREHSQFDQRVAPEPEESPRSAIVCCWECGDDAVINLKYGFVLVLPKKWTWIPVQWVENDVREARESPLCPRCTKSRKEDNGR